MNDDDLERERAGAPADAHSGLAGHDLAALGAFVDGELAPDEQSALLARLGEDPAAAQRIAAYRAQKAALQSLCNHAGNARENDGEHDADALGATPYVVLRRRDPWWRRAGLAAAWAIVGAGLATAATTFVPAWMARGDGHAGALFASEGERFARRADVAYAVYSPEVRHPVEVGAADEAHLVAWLSRRLGKPLQIPSLGEYGYALVGGRLLPGAAGPAAQFMYQNDAGERLTLYVSVSGRDRDAVHLLRDGAHRTFYWSTDSMGYALSGPATEGRLRTIAYDVCGALGGTSAQW
ncbi:anti-sigma factor family protein [Paraburkholderia tropica]|uniref:Transmembrane transcriptional regulator (Anti-sigma factor RsiW) n=1 Tax=Paraburkholderia tropica TaxID=92647 RepID=A0AAQ1GH86_9BURK|nr:MULTISPECIES: anti-sigma factor [Paraburkholderia]MBB3002479.1 anti-sigma factor RsiW [Paraburkholderia tropica]MBB6317609.1 anti-sigma factor RsiW [Paraburkholderia tropica]SEJ86251.1 Transmembrane transcriptional regulator (anti-sigma factor RsiW) [Paraburkholderia tropica]